MWGRVIAFISFLFVHPSWAVDNKIELAVQIAKSSQVSIRGSQIEIFQGKYPVLSLSGFEQISIRPEPGASGLLKIELNKSNTSQIVSGPIGIRGALISVNGKLVPDHFKIYRDSTGYLEVVTNLELEEYITGVLPSEMPASWPMEALKAQAVVARTYALYKKNQSSDSNSFDLVSTSLDQVYKIGNFRKLEPKYQKKIQQAVFATNGQILVGEDKEPIGAFYHADCGGHTVAAQQVWQGRSQTEGVEDPYCPNSPYGKWKVHLTAAELKESSKKLFHPPQEIKTLKVTQLSNDGRVERLTLNDNLSLRGSEFRKIMGFSKVKSTFFTLKKLSDRWLIEGKGYGHGVGMCQWGAKHLSMQKRDYKQILKHYFKKGKLTNLN